MELEEEEDAHALCWSNLTWDGGAGQLSAGKPCCWRSVLCDERVTSRHVQACSGMLDLARVWPDRLAPGACVAGPHETCVLGRTS
jgi:hypothetical protein